MLSVSAWLLLLASPFIGSFIGVVIVRARAPRTILFGRSACPHCHARLGPLDLVPLASWLSSRGRCRHCGAAIGRFYPAIELAALGVAVWAAALTQGWLLWASCLLGWTLLALAVIDWRCFLLPDFLTLPLLAAGLAIFSYYDKYSIFDRLIGVIAGGLFVLAVRQLYWLVRHREGIGLGDAKLLAAAGAWVSWQGLPSVMLLATLTGLATALLRSHRGSSISLTERVSFGAFLCLGIWIVWLYGPLA